MKKNYNKKVKTRTGTNLLGLFTVSQELVYTGNFWRSFDYFNEAIDKTKEIANKLEDYRIEKEKEGIRFYVFLSNPYRNSNLKDYFHFDDGEIDDKTKAFYKLLEHLEKVKTIPTPEVTRDQEGVGIWCKDRKNSEEEFYDEFLLSLAPFKMNPFNSYTENSKRLVGKVHRDYGVSDNNSEPLPLEEILKV